METINLCKHCNARPMESLHSVPGDGKYYTLTCTKCNITMSKAIGPYKTFKDIEQAVDLGIVAWNKEN